jgi:F-type H+-transporting ATPase subunit a
MEHELWLTAFLNNIIGGPVTSLLTAIGFPPEHPGRPIANYFAMELLVVAVIMIVLVIVRSRLSVDRPGNLQQSFEALIEFIETQCEEIIGHGGKQFAPLLFTLAIFIFPSNVLGEIPHLETPTAFIAVTLGCALVAFVYYNFWGIRQQGAVGYLKHFLGPVIAIAPLMFLIEIISHLARAMSLSVRLYANMLAGENITAVFRSLVPIGLPALFMFIHVLVAGLQTYIFILLTTVYLSSAVAHEH